MKIILKIILIFGFSLHLGLPALGVEFFDINKPGIEKIKISVTANESTDIIDPLVGQLKNQLGKTLLFTVVAEPSKASYKLEINATTSSDTISATLSGSQSSFEAITSDRYTLDAPCALASCACNIPTGPEPIINIF